MSSEHPLQLPLSHSRFLLPHRSPQRFISMMTLTKSSPFLVREYSQIFGTFPSPASRLTMSSLFSSTRRVASIFEVIGFKLCFSSEYLLVDLEFLYSSSRMSHVHFLDTRSMFLYTGQFLSILPVVPLKGRITRPFLLSGAHAATHIYILLVYF